MRQKEPPRVRGPYKERRGWRLVVFEEAGRRSLHFSTEAEALRRKAALARELERTAPRTIATMLDEYVEHKIETGRSLPYIAQAERRRLVALLGPFVEQDIGAVTPARAAALYQQLTVRPSVKTNQPLSAASHRCYLVYAKTFFGWAVRRGYLLRSPFEGVQPVGKPNRGKLQLRIEEAHRFIDRALRRFTEERRPLALASLVALYMGLRASEILKRQVRDLDAGGRILWVDFGKTRNARRHLKVPAAIRPYLRQLCEGKRSDEYIFGEREPYKPEWRQYLWAEVRLICRLAEVPIVCPHSLRGLYATLAVESGAVSDAVAASLGHGSFSMTERHYAEPASVMNARTARVASLLPGSGEDEDDGDEALELLRKLDRATLTRLLTLAKKEGAADPN